MTPGIVIVEDTPVVSQTLATFLRIKAPNTPFYSCTTGKEALDLCKHIAVSYMILDYALPDTDGITLAKNLLASWPDMAIMMYTGQSEPRIHQQAFQAGCTNVLVKPASLRTLWEAMQPFVTEGAPQPSIARSFGAETIDRSDLRIIDRRMQLSPAF